MIKLVAWIIWLVFILLLCYSLSKRVLLTPQFGFVGCFIPQAIYAIIYVKAWELDFSFETILVLFGGTLFFFMISVVLQAGYASLRKRQFLLRAPEDGSTQMIKRKINIEVWKLIFLIIVQVIILLIVVYYIIQNINGSTLLDKIVNYNKLRKFGSVDERINLPSVLSAAYVFCTSSSYIVVYILLHSIILKYRQHRILLIVSIMLSVLAYALRGGRFPIVALFIAAITQAYFISGRINNWQTKLKSKTILWGVILFFIAVCSFQAFGGLLGRSSARSFSEYLSIYLSAELKNLDVFIRNGNFGCDISNWQTLYSLVNSLGKWLRIPQWIHGHDQPYVFVNGNRIGNVYTTFYWYLHDGGYLAVGIFLAIFAATSQMFFQKAAYGKQKSGINISIILYSYLFYGIIFSFYCERYYMLLLTTTILEMIASWMLLSFFFTKVRFVWGKKHLYMFPLQHYKMIKMNQKF